MATKYTNPISITSARKIVVQQPVDDRGEFETIAAITTSIVNDEHEAWFEYMLTYVKEIHEVAAWLDAASLPTGVDGDDLIAGTTVAYAAGYPDAQYAGKTFGFYRLRSIPVAHTHVEADIPTLDKYTQAEVNALVAAKEDSLPSNATGSTAYLTKNAADDTYSWVIFTGVSAPSNTGKTYGYRGITWAEIQDPTAELFTATSYIGGVPANLELLVPVHATVQGDETWTLADPASMPVGYNAVITHDGASAIAAQLNGYPIDGTNPFNIPQTQSVWIGVVDGVWRRLDNIT